MNRKGCGYPWLSVMDTNSVFKSSFKTEKLIVNWSPDLWDVRPLSTKMIVTDAHRQGYVPQVEVESVRQRHEAVWMQRWASRTSRGVRQMRTVDTSQPRASLPAPAWKSSMGLFCCCGMSVMSGMPTLMLGGPNLLAAPDKAAEQRQFPRVCLLLSITGPVGLLY